MQQQAARLRQGEIVVDMKIFEIIAEGILDPEHESEPESDPADFDAKFSDMYEPRPEMELSSDVDTKMINAVRRACDEYKGQGHAQVEMLPFLSRVMELAKKPVNLADLIAINKKSAEIQSMVDSIDEKKIKFKNMSVKNEDPKKEKKDSSATISSMATRARNKRA